MSWYWADKSFVSFYGSLLIISGLMTPPSVPATLEHWGDQPAVEIDTSRDDEEQEQIHGIRDPDVTGSGSGKTGSRPRVCRIWIRQNRIQFRMLPDLDPAKPDLEPDPDLAMVESKV